MTNGPDTTEWVDKTFEEDEIAFPIGATAAERISVRVESMAPYHVQTYLFSGLHLTHHEFTIEVAEKFMKQFQKALNTAKNNKAQEILVPVQIDVPVIPQEELL